MNTFKVKNFREAMLQSLKILSNEGVEIIPRGMKTKEIENVLFELSNPQDKVALIEGRKANIFATLAETLWVLGGRNDLDFISHYVPRMEDFSDPNRVLYGGYGPRIQKWHSVNQLEQIYLILKKDNSSRRAVISLFDPSRDFFSDDFPCTNWLHFTIRSNKLNLKVVSRSMDIIWGATLNFFEWSVIQEIVANWLDVKVGELTYFVSSLHIYEEFYERMDNILANPLNTREFECLEWNIPYEIFESEIIMFFNEESKLRLLKYPDFSLIKTTPIKVSLILLLSYNYYKLNRYKESIDVLKDCPNCDLKIMALDYYNRNLNYNNLI